MKTKSRKPFLYLVMIFVLPMITSALLFHYRSHFHFKTLNHGTLLEVPINVSTIFPLEETKKYWRIVHVQPPTCDESCNSIDFTLAQVKKALGKDQDRVNIELIEGHDSNLKLLQEQSHLAKVTATIYLIDPRNNLFMYYPDKTNPMNILKDMKKVLEVSQIG